MCELSFLSLCHCNPFSLKLVGLEKNDCDSMCLIGVHWKLEVTHAVELPTERDPLKLALQVVEPLLHCYHHLNHDLEEVQVLEPLVQCYHQLPRDLEEVQVLEPLVPSNHQLPQDLELWAPLRAGFRLQNHHFFPIPSGQNLSGETNSIPSGDSLSGEKALR